MAASLIAAVLLSPSGIEAQGVGPHAAPDAGGDVVHMDVAVTTKNGDPVRGLTAADFTLREDKSARPIASVREMNAGATPTEGIVLIDDVNTNITTIGYERQQIDAFLRTSEGKLPFPMRLAVLTDTGTQLGKAASVDGNALASQLDQMEIGLREVRRNTGFYGAVERFQISLKTLDGLVQAVGTDPGRKVVFWVSPGWPALSGPGVELSRAQELGIYTQAAGISTALREHEIVLYNINPLGVGESVSAQTYYQSFLTPLRRPEDAQYGNLNLQVIAEQSGGLVLTSNDVRAMLARCAEDAASFYRMTFAALPADRSLTLHTVQVQVNKPGVTARTRSGYYVGSPSQ